MAKTALCIASYAYALSKMYTYDTQILDKHISIGVRVALIKYVKFQISLQF